MLNSISKRVMAAVASLIALALLTLGYCMVFARGSRGLFEGTLCACGHPKFVRIAEDGYFVYSPGHDVAEERRYALRARDGEWDMLALRPPENAWSPIREGEIVGRLKIEGGDLYECASGTNWVRYRRVLNPYRVWFVRLWGHS